MAKQDIYSESLAYLSENLCTRREKTLTAMVNIKETNKNIKSILPVQSSKSGKKLKNNGDCRKGKGMGLFYFASVFRGPTSNIILEENDTMEYALSGTIHPFWCSKL